MVGSIWRGETGFTEQMAATLNVSPGIRYYERSGV
jgi:hypothetical protein